jgi:hypothetical protein
MTFDKNKWLKTEFQPRTSEVKLLQLADWFSDGEPIFVVRGLTGNEVGRVRDALIKNKNIESIIEAISENSDQIDKLKEAIGIGAETPFDVIKRLEELTIALIDPSFTIQDAVKFAERHPIEFYQLTNEINRLTGLGLDVKKSQNSGMTSELETR